MKYHKRWQNNVKHPKRSGKMMKDYKISWMMKKDHEIPKITKDEKIMWKGMKNHETYEETLWNILKDDERSQKIMKY